MEEPKCKICGDTGRAKPTLSEPDGEECECTKEPGIMECEPHIIGRTLTANDIYEIRAEVFRKMTGIMAPGKDESANYDSGYSYEERSKRFKSWLREYCEAVDTAIKETMAYVR